MPDMTPVRWPPESTPRAEEDAQKPPLAKAMLRGGAGRCPRCGEAPLFNGYLRVRPICGACEAPLGEVRADDAPPYFTIFIVGHIVVGLMVLADRRWDWAASVQALVFLPLTLILTLALLRPVKGATVGLMMHLGIGMADNGN